MVNVFQRFILIEGINCLLGIGVDANKLADCAEEWCKKCDDAFK